MAVRRGLEFPEPSEGRYAVPPGLISDRGSAGDVRKMIGVKDELTPSIGGRKEAEAKPCSLRTLKRTGRRTKRVRLRLEPQIGHPERQLAAPTEIDEWNGDGCLQPDGRLEQD